MPRGIYVRKLPPHEERAALFWSHVDKSGECWIWTASKSRFGYGQVGSRNAAGERVNRRAHRAAWELTHGPIFGRAYCLHTCDVPACVKPAHLFLGSFQDNMDDRQKKGRQRGGPNSPGRLTIAPDDRGSAQAQPDERTVNAAHQEAGGGGEDQAKHDGEQPVVHGSIINQGGWS